MADAVLDPTKKGLEVSRPYLAQGAGETIDSLKNRYAGLIQEGGFGGGGEGVLGSRLNALRARKLQDQQDQLDLNMPLLYADRMKGFKGISDVNKQVLDAEEQQRAQALAAKKAKRAALVSGALGLAGMAAGGYLAPVGYGAVGAGIGGGLGQIAGSQL